jgi:uracil-DNA glycosylase family 4
MDSDFVPAEHNTNSRVLVVGEAPGAEEVKLKAPFVGQSGKLLNGAMREFGYSREDASYVNVVACRPPGNRTPTEDEIRCCKGRLERDIVKADPQTILAVGKTAREVVHPNATSIRASWGTYYCKLNTTAYPVMSTWHPAYVLRKPSEGTNFLKDVRTAFGGFQAHATQRAPEVIMPETYEDLAQVLSTAPDNSLVAYDLETNQIGWYHKPNKRANSILMMGISWDPGMGVIVSDELLYDEPRTIPLLAEFFRTRKPIGHNIKFDNCFLRHQLDLHVKAYMDTLLAHFVLDENSMHGLKILAQEELGVHDYEHALISQYLSSKNDEYSKVPYEHMAQYCAWDVAVTLSLAEIFEARLYKEGLHDWPFMNLYMPAQDAMTTQQLRGVQVDVGYLEHCQELFGARLEDIRYNAGKMVGKPDINLGSWQQVGAVLWDDLRLPQSHNRKVKERSTNELAVMHLRGKHPFVDTLMKYRRIAKLKSSYIDNMLQYVDVNGRIHPDVLLYGTEMGRISMRDPAVQTIPRPDDPSRAGYDPYEDGGVIRGAIIAAPGHMFGACDFSQAELRALAQLSGEQFLRQAYMDGRDIHSEVSVAMFGENFTKEQRVQCKMFNFSYVYGGSEYSFAEDAGLPVAVAREFVRRYNSIMPTALEWKKQQFDKMRSQGYVETIFGQRRRFPLITPDNQDDARKASVHSAVAGSAAGITILAQTKLIEEGVPVVMSVHDSIEFESPEDRIEEDAIHVQEVMIETALKYMPEVPWKVDVEIGSRWVKPPQL